MAAKTILTNNQRKILEIISQDNSLTENFYLTGGTALAEFYLGHRLSEDLDFFSEKEFDSSTIAVFWQKHQKSLGIKKVAYEQSFNRQLFFLKLKNETIKTEFTYFPFPRVEKKKKINKLDIDSLTDIAVNKIFTIYQKPRARDFVDLYFICSKQGWNIDDLARTAKSKFDWHIDPLLLGSQFLQATTVKDFPRMIIKTANKDWQDFFKKQAEMIGKTKVMKD
ncbi:nucleotidyl transferase AbiEii/AbiGii toxin family protein [Patescibacteria group bacterium]|nr:nucleotidyl transferase AbiEii/AbiGii toxin family protein [Patescibacteria group bacterium]MBU4511759.1 nucleotidyl transferase AbiEii/AbiGii toxin family protein [Patescibacteria group bacterium]